MQNMILIIENFLEKIVITVTDSFTHSKKFCWWL